LAGRREDGSDEDYVERSLFIPIRSLSGVSKVGGIT